jgi:uncharacterized protein (TIGR00369 family)
MLFTLPTLIPNHRADLKRLIEQMPASRLLGLHAVGFGEGVSVIEMPVRPELTLDGRTVIGGFVGTLADYAAVSATTASRVEGWYSATTSFDVHNVDAAIGTKLIALGRAIKASKSSGVGAADVFALRDDGTATLVATALATCRLFQLPAQSMLS